MARCETGAEIIEILDDDSNKTLKIDDRYLGGRKLISNDWSVYFAIENFVYSITLECDELKERAFTPRNIFSVV